MLHFLALPEHRRTQISNVYRLMYELEMSMGTRFPVGMDILWEFHGNGNKTWKLEWEGIRMMVDENENDPYSHGKKSHGFYCTTIPPYLT